MACNDSVYTLLKAIRCNLTSPEAVVQRCSPKKVFWEISQNSQENTCARASFLIKLQAWDFIKNGALPQVFSCEICEISQNTLFSSNTSGGCFWIEHLNFKWMNYFVQLVAQSVNPNWRERNKTAEPAKVLQLPSISIFELIPSTIQVLSKLMHREIGGM